jgi:transcriptional regulator with XRE-family HTH domain
MKKLRNLDQLSPVRRAMLQARMERGIGVRELARRLKLNHARVKQLEDAGRGRSENIEVQSLARLAKALAYKVRIVLEPEEGGRLLEARL